MKTLFALIFTILFSPFNNFAGDFRSHVYHENFDGGVYVFADNDEYCPVSILITFELANMESTEGNNKVFLIPARTKRFFIADLKVLDTHAAYKLRYSTRTQYGNAEQTNFDKDIVYWLPYKTGSTYKLFQGYNGKQTHQGINALDFSLTEGNEIHAARKGVVVKVVQQNSKHCSQPECAKLNNFILIYHEDGTFASYAHLQQNGAQVIEGDIVNQGQLIALSGNVGRTDGPHLHFEVFLQQLEKRTTIQTYFLTTEGKKEVLKEGSEYTKNY